MKKTQKLQSELRRLNDEKKKRVNDAIKESAKKPEILFKFNTNLDFENRSRAGAVAVTRDFIFSAIEPIDSDKDVAVSVERYKLTDFIEFIARRNVGSISLEAIGESETVEICRTDMELSSYVIDAARTLNAMLDNLDNPEYNPIFETEKKHCPKCHRVLKNGVTLCPHCNNAKSLVLRLFAMVRKDLLLLITAFFLYITLSILKIANPVLQQILVDDYITITEPKDNLLLGIVVICTGIFLAGALYRLTEIVRANILSKINNKLMKKLRSVLFEKIQALSVSSISKRTAGELINRVSGDTRTISRFLIDFFPGLVENVSLIVILGISMFLFNPVLALLILIPAPIIAYVTKKVWFYTHRLYHRQWQMESQSNTILHDTFQGIRVVKVFGMENKEIKRYDDVIKKVADVSEKNEITWAKIIPYMTYLVGIGEYIVLSYVGTKILNDGWTLGQLTMFTFFSGQIYSSFRMLTGIPRQIVQIITSTRKVFEIIDEDVDVKDSPNAKEIEIEGNVELRDVSFGYEGGEDVLRRVSLSVKKGDMIGIVGKSGAGKSTLINLIMRLYDVRDGEILVDGVNIKDITQHSLRSQIGVVLQETFLFSGTIYDNLLYAAPNATREEIISAAKLAGAHKFIMKLPDGYNTKVGERGGTLSGGERQRIAIARAILRDPKILILDEATSALDTETERLIQDSISSLVKDRTTFAIAHRLSTLRNATKLIVIDKGRIAEFGTHEELMKAGGIYYSLVLAQRKMSSMSHREEIAK